MGANLCRRSIAQLAFRQLDERMFRWTGTKLTRRFARRGAGDLIGQGKVVY
jgi:hypothetical protein